MTWGNIAIVIGPNILRPRRDTMETMLDVKDINTLVEFLFETIAETQKEEESSSAIERKKKEAKELEKLHESKKNASGRVTHLELLFKTDKWRSTTLWALRIVETKLINLSGQRVCQFK